MRLGRLLPFPLLPLLVASVLAAACSPAGNPATPDAGDPGDTGPTVSCVDDPLAQTYTANLANMGKSGIFQLVLASSDPAPPARGSDTWSVKVQDATGNAVSGVTLDVLPFMPKHGHGTSVKATITPQPDGSFSVTPLYFFMPGLWQVTFGVHTATQNDSVVFSFCVAG